MFTPFIPVIIFFAVLKGHQLKLLNWITASLVAVILPFVITVFIGFILSGNSINLLDIFSIKAIVTLVVQIIVALGVFRYIEHREDSIAVWVTVAFLGCVVIYYAIPYIVGRIL